MLNQLSPLAEHQHQLAQGKPLAEVVATTARHANSNASHNTYLSFSEAALAEQAATLPIRFPNPASRPPLYGVPISLKDCFDLAGTITTCGAKFYAEHHQPAAQDSAMAARLRASGALITGKTHLHPLAYGITGQNPDFGDCLQPRDSALLTGGSSSGANASVQEGSALAAIGTDTGGSVRVPAALCGLAGYRASHRLAYAPGPWPAGPEGLWTGAAHLAASFDTVGLLLRDPRDTAALAQALFGLDAATPPPTPRIGCVSPAFLTDSDPDVLSAFQAWQEVIRTTGASLADFDTATWSDAQDVFAGVQAHEAAALHRGHYDEFEPSIAQRLHWGASLTPDDLAPLRQRWAELRSTIVSLFDRFDFLMLPCAPVSRLFAAEDHAPTRPRILRYTTAFSLASLPVVALPGEIIGAAFGTGIQIAAAPGNDASLLAFTSGLAQHIVDTQASSGLSA